MKETTKNIIALTLITFSVLSTNAQTLLFESFENPFGSLFTTGGWHRQNNSIPLGDFGWEDGTGLSVATPHSGKGYVRAWFQNTDSIGNISNWLITPALLLQNGDTVEFWTSALFNDQSANRLECRLSKMGASNNVGTSDTTVGDFTTLLVSVNPLLLTGYSYYAPFMTKYNSVVSGLSGPTSCKIAFRYWVTDGGNFGSNSTYIGLDDVQIFRGSPSANVDNNNNGITFNVYPNPANNKITIELKQKTEIEIQGIKGQIIKRLKVNENKTEIDISDFPSGVYIIRAQTDRGRTTEKFIKE
jgi:hypothetical protein